MVNPDVTSPDSGRAFFSPDGRYLAIQSFRPSGSLIDVYVIDLREVLAPPAHAVQLQFLNEPITGIVDSPLNPVSVLVEDSLGTPAPFVSITLELGTAINGGVLSGILTAITDESGIATFDGLSIDQIGQNYTLLASAEDITKESLPLDIIVSTTAVLPILHIQQRM